MISYETYCKIKQYRDERHLSVPQIAQALGIDQKTVIRWLAAPGYQPRQHTPRSSKLDPHKKQIIQWLETHPYSATQIFQRLKECDFDGGITIVTDYVRKVRPRAAPAFLKLSFEPGECAQMDWGEWGSVAVGETRRRLSFFVMVLCYSRLMYVEFTVSQTMEHFLGCHQRAFQAFGKVPRKIMVDNLRSAVLKRLTGEAPVLNPRYRDNVFPKLMLRR
jgi:transposase